jgi:hypothetical protein
VVSMMTNGVRNSCDNIAKNLRCVTRLNVPIPRKSDTL